MDLKVLFFIFLGLTVWTKNVKVGTIFIIVFIFIFIKSDEPMLNNRHKIKWQKKHIFSSRLRKM